MPHLDPGLAGVTAPAEALKIGQRVGEVRAVSDGLDVIHLKPFARPALYAPPVVTFERL